MKEKTDARRQAIINAATAIFRDVGYGRASMNAISARLGGSKATLYSYFSSKEELFAVSMMEALEDHAQDLLGILSPSSAEVENVLLRFSQAYLHLVTRPDVLALSRTAIGEGAQTSLGRMLYDRGIKRALDGLAEYIERLSSDGALQKADPRLAAVQLRGLLEAGVVEPLLYGALPEFSIEETASAAVKMFLNTYR